MSFSINSILISRIHKLKVSNKVDILQVFGTNNASWYSRSRSNTSIFYCCTNSKHSLRVKRKVTAPLRLHNNLKLRGQSSCLKHYVVC